MTVLEQSPRVRGFARAPSRAPARADAIIDRHGRYGRAVVSEARRARLPLPLACALVEQESNFRNIFGADRVANPIPKHSAVTRESYLRYRAFRDRGLGAQGVGVTQLTFKGFQDQADQLGGSWKVENQLRVGFSTLAALVRRHGEAGGLAAYNAGSPASPAGKAYASSVLAKRERWRGLLAGAAAPPSGPRPRPSGGGRAPRTLRLGDRGPDVALLQRTLNGYYDRWKAPRALDVDGALGPATLLAFRRVRLVLGLAPATSGAGEVLISPRDRGVLRRPVRRTAAELARASGPGRAYERKLTARFAGERTGGAGRPKVIRLGLAFDESKLDRNVAIRTTVGHHSAGPVDRNDGQAIELCRRWHRMHQERNGWLGIGYHVCIARSGTIILLRPGWAKGAGVEGHNTGTFHVMFNGDFRHDRPSKAQIESYRWFVRHGHEIDGIPRQGAQRLGHRDFPGHESNECPGPNLHPYVKGS